jgi:hypothetical protein
VKYTQEEDMDQVITTILYDGQFWIALIEKVDPTGIIKIGKYTFGSEPSNNDLRYFYLYLYSSIECLKSTIHIRIKNKRTIEEQNRSTTKAKEAYKQLQTIQLKEKKRESKEERELEEQEKYLKKQEKRKEKHNGH